MQTHHIYKELSATQEYISAHVDRLPADIQKNLFEKLSNIQALIILLNDDIASAIMRGNYNLMEHDYEV